VLKQHIVSLIEAKFMFHALPKIKKIFIDQQCVVFFLVALGFELRALRLLDM
jgi:hypothetical protein